ncbi:ABC transporter permease [Acidihalobacter prosperus]|nr:ABC transporter permease subunit [Acidihalobacter prosperus]
MEAKGGAAGAGGAAVGRWVIFGVVSIGLWAVVARLYGQTYLLPDPLQVLLQAGRQPGLLLHFTLITAAEIGIGFVVGSVAALLVSVALLGLPHWLRDYIQRLVVTLNSVPFVAMAGLVVIWFPAPMEAQTVAAALFCFFAVVYHTHQAFGASPPLYEDLMTSYSASFMQRLLYLKLPASLPVLMTSLKGGAMAAVNGAIVGELFGAYQGLGFLIMDSRYVGNTPRVFLSALLCTVLGWLLMGLLELLERRVLGWHRMRLRAAG